MVDADVVPIDRERPPAVTAAQRRIRIGGKLARAIRLLPSIDPSKGEKDVAGDELENLLLSITCEELDYLVPEPTPEQDQTVADLRAEALHRANLDEVVQRVANRAQRLAHMIAIGASGGFIRMAGYDQSLRTVVNELLARVPADEETPTGGSAR